MAIYDWPWAGGRPSHVRGKDVCDQDIKVFVFKAQTLMPQVMLLWLASASGWLATFARNDLQACIIDEAIGITISCCMTMPGFP